MTTKHKYKLKMWLEYSLSWPAYISNTWK